VLTLLSPPPVIGVSSSLANEVLGRRVRTIPFPLLVRWETSKGTLHSTWERNKGRVERRDSGVVSKVL
jgi:hypothetical protein